MPPLALLSCHHYKNCAARRLPTSPCYLRHDRCFLLLVLAALRRYNSVMKIIYLGATGAIVYLMRYDKAVRGTYDRDQDTFRHQFLAAPCFVLALVWNYGFNFTEVRR